MGQIDMCCLLVYISIDNDTIYDGIVSMMTLVLPLLPLIM